MALIRYGFKPREGGETVGNRLQILEGEVPPTVLVATGPLRFRIEGTWAPARS